MWPIRNHPDLIVRGQAYFAAHGGKSVFFGRFFGPIRAIVPIIAGMTRHAGGALLCDERAVGVRLGGRRISCPGALFGASLQLAGAVSARLVALSRLSAVGLWLVVQSIQLAGARGLTCACCRNGSSIAREAAARLAREPGAAARRSGAP